MEHGGAALHSVVSSLTTSSPASGGQISAALEKQNQGRGTERCPCQKRRRGTKTVPQQPRHKAGDHQRDPADQIEKP